MEILKGTISNITYRNEDNGYSVFELETDSEEITAVGILPFINVGEEVTLQGEFTNHPTYGPQFKVENCERELPNTVASILRYLSSRAIKGIGPATAQTIVSTFGTNTLDVIENSPERLTEIRGISLNKARKISQDFKEQFGVREVMLKLTKLNISASEALRIYKKLGNESVQHVLENPYKLIDEGIGFGFSRADEISRSLENQIPNDYRVSAGIEYVLKHNLLNGHTCLPKDKLCETASKMLETELEDVQTNLNNLIYNGRLTLVQINEKDFIFLHNMYRAERYCANRIALMLKVPPSEVPIHKTRLEQFEESNSILYDEIQRLAISQALSQGLLILTGGPGTGKTTTLNAIITLLEEAGTKIALAAPTGRAAKRMSELTGRNAQTLHRLLEVEWGNDDLSRFKRNESNPLSENAIIVDELSMLDISLFEALLKAMSVNARLILVGDVDQLPSVGAGNVLGDLIESSVIPVVRLERVFRQSLQSHIVLNAHKIISGEMPTILKNETDFFLTNAANPAHLISELFCERIENAYGFKPKDNIQILCPSRKSYLGTVNLNNEIQRVINPPSESKKEFRNRGYILREGDKVMQVKNNYDVTWKTSLGEEGSGIYNGDIGVLQKIEFASSTVIVRFEDKLATFTGDEVENLELAYAVTVHKSQGSEFDCVILPVSNVPHQLMYRNLLYTAVTRAKKLLIIIGTKSELKEMIENNKKTLRYTGFKHFLTTSIEQEGF